MSICYLKDLYGECDYEHCTEGWVHDNCPFKEFEDEKYEVLLDE